MSELRDEIIRQVERAHSFEGDEYDYVGSDDVADTIHYGEAAERIAAIVSGAPVNLLETLAQRIADELLSRDIVRMVTVTVHKPQAPIPVPFGDVSVTIRRARPAAPSAPIGAAR